MAKTQSAKRNHTQLDRKNNKNWQANHRKHITFPFLCYTGSHCRQAGGEAARQHLLGSQTTSHACRSERGRNKAKEEMGEEWRIDGCVEGWVRGWHGISVQVL